MCWICDKVGSVCAWAVAPDHDWHFQGGPALPDDEFQDFLAELGLQGDCEACESEAAAEPPEAERRRAPERKEPTGAPTIPNPVSVRPETCYLLLSEPVCVVRRCTPQSMLWCPRSPRRPL